MFECPECGYQDFMGNTEVCPVCDPDKDAEQDICFFVSTTTKDCRQDGAKCPHIEDKSWAECPKLENK